MDYTSILKSKLHQSGASPQSDKQKAIKIKPIRKQETVIGNRKPYSPPEDEEDEDENLSIKEQKEKIRRLQIGNEKSLNALIARDIMISVIGELGQSVQNNFVDLAKRNSTQWAAELGIPERDREIEKLISDMIEGAINGFISDIDRFCNKEMYE